MATSDLLDLARRLGKGLLVDAAASGAHLGHIFDRPQRNNGCPLCSGPVDCRFTALPFTIEGTGGGLRIAHQLVGWLDVLGRSLRSYYGQSWAF